MQQIMSLGLAGAFLLSTALPTHAGACKRAIDRVQAQVDAAIDSSAGSRPWQPESVDALRSHQPTPRSVAAAEGASDHKYDLALIALKRARAADRAGNLKRCNAELGRAASVLQSP